MGAIPDTGSEKIIMQRIQSLQIFRAFAAIMVVFFHAHSYMLPHKIEDGASVFKGFNMGYAGVEIFFVISGFIMFYSHRNDIGNPSKYLSYAYKRVVRIYPVYLLVLLALVGLYFIVPGSGPENARNMPEILLSATLLPTPFKPVMEVAWTLQFEMFFYLLFSILIINRKIGQGVFALWAFGCIINLFVNTDIFPLSFVFSAYQLLFMAGAIGAYVLHTTSLPARYSVGVFSLGLLLYFCVGMVESYQVIEWYTPLRTVLYGIGAFL